MDKEIIVKENRQHGNCHDVFELVLANIPDSILEAKAGQFVSLEPIDTKSVMPRPFSVVSVNKEQKTITLLIKVVGSNTKYYSELKEGKKINVIGPLGQPIPYNKDLEKYILVGGGIGSAALMYLGETLKQANKEVIVLIGARCDEEMVGCDIYNDLGCQVGSITDNVGFVTELLNKELATEQDLEVIACGPKSMLGAVHKICVEKNKNCLVMLEEVMACGTGSCKGCAINGVDGTVKHICTDGPALESTWIDWNVFIEQETRKNKQEIKSNSSNPFKVELIGKEGRKLVLDYPTMNASGCLGIEALEKKLVDVSKMGALMTKGVTCEVKPGNAMPRVCETPSGMINSIGLENLGLEEFLKKELDKWFQYDKPVLVNISGYSVEDFITLAKAFNDTKVAGIEVNISCPNIKGGGMSFGVDPVLTKEVVKEARLAAPDKFMIVKLSPNVTNIVEIAQAAVESGADCLSLINTLQGMAIDVMTGKPKVATVYGGLSGPAVRPVAVRMVNQLFKADLGVPIIGMGGIDSGEAAAEFFLAGANAISVGTGIFKENDIYNQLNKPLEAIIKNHGGENVNDLVGKVAS